MFLKIKAAQFKSGEKPRRIAKRGKVGYKEEEGDEAMCQDSEINR